MVVTHVNYSQTLAIIVFFLFHCLLNTQLTCCHVYCLYLCILLK